VERRLIAASAMLTGARPPEPAVHHPCARIDALAEVGVTEMGLSISADGRRWGPWAPIRTYANDRGVWISEIDVVTGWAERAGPSPESTAAETIAYEIADAFESEHLVVVATEPPESIAPTSELAERFGAMCDRAAGHGLRVALEFVPFGAVDTAAAALDIVDLAGRPNGGVLVDAWHVCRGATTVEMLRAIPADRIVVLQWSDAAIGVEGSLRDDTLDRRRFPADGEFDLAGLMSLFDSRGVDAPLSVEVLSKAVRAMPLADIAERVAHLRDS
jgi:sugar phosphate isomerase/epimerase